MTFLFLPNLDIVFSQTCFFFSFQFSVVFTNFRWMLISYRIFPRPLILTWSLTVSWPAVLSSTFPRCHWPLLGTKYTTKPSHRLFLLCCPQMENSQVSCNILPSSRTLPTSDCGYMTTEELAESCPQNVRVPVHTDERLVTGILSGLSQRLYWFQVSVMTGLVMLGAACWKQICALSSIKGSSWTLTSE